MQKNELKPKLNDAQRHQVLAALDDILNTDRFRAAPQMSAFLNYVVRQAAEGRHARIKAFTVAVEALGKSEDFDSQNDPVVRVLAGRLRASLAEYYRDHPATPVQIAMCKGSYVPSFVYTDGPAKTNNQPRTPDLAEEGIHKDKVSDAGNDASQSFRVMPDSVVATKASRKRVLLLATIAALALFAIYKGGEALRQPANSVIAQTMMQSVGKAGIRSRPEQLSVFISATDEGNELQKKLNTLVSGVIFDSDNVSVYRMMEAEPTVNFWPEDYILTLDPMSLSDETRVSLQLMDAQTGRLSYSEDVSLGAMAEVELSESDLSNVIAIAQKLINEQGPLFEDYQKKSLP